MSFEYWLGLVLFGVLFKRGIEGVERFGDLGFFVDWNCFFGSWFFENLDVNFVEVFVGWKFFLEELVYFIVKYWIFFVVSIGVVFGYKDIGKFFGIDILFRCFIICCEILMLNWFLIVYDCMLRFVLYLYMVNKC